ncbi:1,4-dihydroxy-6-naphthoate synthase [Desulforhopalus sp. IMCC35007]|uniref:1,4-dihydroxy-6-naphthoate synthase n=1 Tax=Desulforhopalus sp. IMCC35007 TaxID=2569543 RepID=UPI0010AEB650|nr:1,4-dihydroxy-6-naphthoate synthase [Desulforhopalus sp. IMCC35007]TKB06708.1 1,4-dihydroxy-6-naphthoate synthase [Desulforhopalus sp. IMCC35007]
MQKNGNLSLGFSPCPNDTFIFYGLVHKLVDCHGLSFSQPLLEDVEQLNNWAVAGVLDVTKLSFHALAHVLDEYCLLATGSALGRGCGPLLVVKDPEMVDITRLRRIAIPGKLTTAALLLQMYLPHPCELVEMRFDRIMAAVKKGEVEAGVIIHESRFTYQQEGLFCLQDLGAWWEETTGMPIPLGGIAAKRSFGPKTLKKIEQVIGLSVEHSFRYPERCLDYIQSYSQELDKEVVESHIKLYVNDFSRNLGTEGRAAVQMFIEKGREKGALPQGRQDIFISAG